MFLLVIKSFLDSKDAGRVVTLSVSIYLKLSIWCITVSRDLARSDMIVYAGSVIKILTHWQHIDMDTRVGPGPGPVTSYSDYMRCLAAKYNNNQNSPPAPTSIPSSLKHDLLPLLAAHQSAFPAFSLPGLSLFNPFLSQQNEVKPPVTSIPSHPSPPRDGPIERPKRHKEDPLDLTDTL